MGLHDTHVFSAKLWHLTIGLHLGVESSKERSGIASSVQRLNGIRPRNSRRCKPLRFSGLAMLDNTCFADNSGKSDVCREGVRPSVRERASFDAPERYVWVVLILSKQVTNSWRNSVRLCALRAGSWSPCSSPYATRSQHLSDFWQGNCSWRRFCSPRWTCPTILFERLQNSSDNGQVSIYCVIFLYGEESLHPNLQLWGAVLGC